MAQVLVPNLQIKAKKEVTCLRELPIAGEILVSEGETVKADQVVATTSLAGELHIFRIADSLGIEGFEVSKGLKVKEGEVVTKGQLICEHAGVFGLFYSRYFAPESGTVEFFSKKTGHLGVRATPRKIELLAHIAGCVKKIEPYKSVLIKAECAYIQGIFGVGGERRGTLTLLPVALDHSLEASDIPANCQDCILVGGTKPSIEAIKKAVFQGATGLIVGSIDDETLNAYLGYELGIALTGDEQIPLTLIITEGFGYMPLASRVQTICKDLVGQLASINGATQVRAGAMRPEIIISREGKTDSCCGEAEGSQGLEVGSKVRLIRVPYFGLQATVEELPSKMEKIASGVEARILRAKLENGEVVTVPRANVELI